VADLYVHEVCVCMCVMLVYICVCLDKYCIHKYYIIIMSLVLSFSPH